MADTKLQVFSGTSNLKLAKDIAKYLKIPLGNAAFKRFSDGEISVNIQESVRGHHTFIVQSTCPPANEHLMEILILIDALKRASATQITVVIPYYGYARQDRKAAPREAITAKLVADLLEAAGATRIIALDLHVSQIQGFFDVPFDHLYATPIFIKDIKKHFLDKQKNSDIVIVSPDAGGVERARAYAKQLHCSLAIIDKRRPKPNVTEIMNIIGDVKGKKAIMIDDMIDTAGTLTKAAEAILSHGATGVWAYATHPVFSGEALERIKKSQLKEVIVTDSIPLSDNAKKIKKIRQLTCSSLVGEAIRRVDTGTSISSLFL